MNTVELTINNDAAKLIYQQTHTGPSQWSELTDRQLLLWASAMSTKLELDDARIALAFLIYGIPAKYYPAIKRAAALDISYTLKWLFKRNKLDRWLIPAVWKGLFKYYGPKSQLSNVTVREFMLTELCYEQFNNTKNPDYLDTLAAILYRPQRFWNIDADIRCELTTNGYVKRAKRFKKLPIRLKLAIYLNYEGCRNFIIDRNKDVFTSRGSSGAKPVKVITPWAKIVESAAGGKFGTMKETKESNLHEFLSELGSRIREYRETEKRLNKS